MKNNEVTKSSSLSSKSLQGWISTITGFTLDTANYLEGNVVKERVDETDVHAITCLTRLKIAKEITLKDLFNGLKRK